MWLLFGWNTDNADYVIHFNKYYNPSNSIIVEPIFDFIILFFRNLGFDYSEFLIALSGCFLVSLFLLSKKLVGDKYPFLLGLYFIFPFLFNIVLFRFSVGLIFSYWGIYLLTKKERKIGWSIFLLLLGGLTHFSLLILLIFPFIIFIKKNTILIITITIMIFEIILIRSSDIITFVANHFDNLLIQKISYVLSHSQSYGFSSTRMFQVILFYGIFLLIYKITINNGKNYSLANFLLKANTIILIILPLMWINSDLYRAQVPLILFNYSLLVSNIKVNSPKKIWVSNIFVSIIGLFSSITFLYIYILSIPSWLTNVFEAIFSNNHFW
jgi:hypothetical protein